MNLSDLASLGSFVSGIVVVVSLVVLILQMRQTSHNQRATIHFQRLAVIQDAVMQIAASPGMLAVNMKGGSGDLSMSLEESFQYFWMTRNTFRIFEELFYQHQDGMLDSARWANNVRRFRGFSMAPGFRAVWRCDSMNYEADYAAWVEKTFSEVATSLVPTDQIQAWKDCVKEELSRSGQAA